LSVGIHPNDLWCTDYKGEFLLGNHKYCYPLKVTDHASRYLLACEALSSTKEDYAFLVFERLLASTEAAQIFRFFGKDSQTRFHSSLRQVQGTSRPSAVASFPCRASKL
jgi:hypothetical protein